MQTGALSDMLTITESFEGGLVASNSGNDVELRLALAVSITNLTTNQVNLLIFALAPPENEIPPMSAPAKERATSLLGWCSRNKVPAEKLKKLLATISGSG